MKKVHFDMGLGAHDDYLALCYLLGCPYVELTGITLYPGSLEQSAIIKQTLRNFNKEHIPVGSNNAISKPSTVSWVHYNFLSDTLQKHNEKADDTQIEILKQSFDNDDCILLTGAPLKNIFDFLNTYEDSKINIWYGQGGFAAGDKIGDSQATRFQSDIEFSANFNAHKKTTLKLLNHKRIKKKYMITKNVTHACMYTLEFHDRLRMFKENNLGLDIFYSYMKQLINIHPIIQIHDVLAACVLIEPSIVKFLPVRMYNKGNRWGSIFKPGSDTFATVYYDDFKFFQILSDTKLTPVKYL